MQKARNSLQLTHRDSITIGGGVIHPPAEAAQDKAVTLIRTGRRQQAAHITT